MTVSIVANNTEPCLATLVSQHALKVAEGPGPAWHWSQETTTREESECVGANCTVLFISGPERLENRPQINLFTTSGIANGYIYAWVNHRSISELAWVWQSETTYSLFHLNLWDSSWLWQTIKDLRWAHFSVAKWEDLHPKTIQGLADAAKWSLTFKDWKQVWMSHNFWPKDIALRCKIWRHGWNRKTTAFGDLWEICLIILYEILHSKISADISKNRRLVWQPRNSHVKLLWSKIV